MRKKTWSRPPCQPVAVSTAWISFCELLVGEAIRVDVVVAAVRRERVVVDVRAAERRLVLDVRLSCRVVLGRDGVDVVAPAAVVGDVREVPVDQGLVARVEGELVGPAAPIAFDSECGATAGRPTVCGTTPRMRASGARGGAARAVTPSAARCEREKSSIERAANPVIPRDRVPEETENCVGQRVSFSALASRPSLRSVAWSDVTELPSVPASPCSRDSCRARYAVWLAT